MLRGEALMHGTVALPQNHARLAQRFRGISAQLLIWIPDDHLVQRNPHAVAGVAPQMFIGKKKNLLAARKSPAHHRRGVRAGAHRAAMLAGKRFNRRSRIHVRHGNNAVRVQHCRKLAPARFHLPDVRHIRHRTSGIQIRQHHHLVIAPQNIRAFGHEMHAAENDVPALRLGGLIRQLERIPAKIGELHHFIALIMVAQNHHVFT